MDSEFHRYLRRCKAHSFLSRIRFNLAMSLHPDKVYQRWLKRKMEKDGVRLYGEAYRDIVKAFDFSCELEKYL